MPCASAAVDGAAVDRGLVQPLAEVKPLEHELQGRGTRCRSLWFVELGEHPVEAAELAHRGVVGLRGGAVADLDGEAAAVEALHHLAELLDGEMAAEDVAAGGAEDLLDHPLVVTVLPGLQ